LTPPDAISQTLLALPMWLLFEVGLFFSRVFVRNKNIDYDYNDDAENHLEKIKHEEN
jgi:sec-independent protein translocase protein TatC